ncbi:NADPH2:quinone reductase [Advenella incenata]|uniref:NADPH2:quinone reductase n=1 Tax=Advenella incenata TaxID=267800 RepID=A0A4Q7VPC8_9BURK|nr:NADPH:quinone oxidoreductase family protein [Advenella incenata]RZT98260.1 NADPH2:quinone reductase [Advenella incenata]
MKAVVCRQYGGAEAANLEEVERPDIQPGSMRISVQACSASFASLLVMEGKHQNKAPLPLIPGTEVAGIITEVGENVTQFSIGDRVIAGVKNGGYAQEVIAPEQTVFRLPENIPFDIGAHFPTIYGTAYGALKWRANLAEGEVALIHGAAGGSGIAAVEVARALGAIVIATAGSEAKANMVKEHGAHHVFNYRKSNWKEEVIRLTDGRGADVIYDPVGGAMFDNSLRCIAPEGRIIPMGFASGDIPQIPANIVLVKNISILGVYWGYYFGWGHHPVGPNNDSRLRAAYAQLFEWASEGKLTPHTHAILPLSEFKTALQMIASREVIGRIIMKPYQ